MVGHRRARRSLIQIAGAGAGSAIYGASQWAVLVVVARLSDADAVGTYAFALAVTAPVALLFGMSLRQAYVTEVASPATFGPYYRLRLASAGVLILALGIAAAVNPGAGPVLFAVGCAKAIDLVSDFLLAPAQKSGDLVSLGVASSLNGLVTLFAISAALLAGAGPEVALSLTLAGSGVALVYAVVALRRHPALRAVAMAPLHRNSEDVENRLAGRRLLWTLVPLGFAAALASARISAPRFLLEGSAGVSELGRYSAAAYLVSAVNTLVIALAQFGLPRLVHYAEARGPRGMLAPLLGISSIWVGVGAVVTVAAFMRGDWLLESIYGPGYGVPQLMGILAIGWSLSAVGDMVDLGLTALRRFGNQFGINLIAVAVTVIAGLALIPDGGVIGTAWVTVISAGTVLCLRIWLLLQATRG